MHDLLYLSESKMQALVPQLPGQLKRRLGIEAGVSVWFASLRATLPGGVQQPPLAVLDEVVRMIERDRVVRQRIESGVTIGDWIRFEEDFRYADASPELWQGDDAAVSRLVYFVATTLPQFVLCGSAVHVLDRRQSAMPSSGPPVGVFYVDAVRAYGRKMSELADEGAISDPLPAPDIGPGRGLRIGLQALHNEAEHHPGWSSAVRLAGHARVLATDDSMGQGSAILATPLYIEYSSSIRPGHGRVGNLLRRRHP